MNPNLERPIAQPARELEAATDLCWPSPYELFGEWILRFGRSTQLRPTAATYLAHLAESSHLNTAITVAQERYEHRGRPLAVQIIDAPDFQAHAALAGTLKHTGDYIESTPSWVYMAEHLESIAGASAPSSSVETYLSEVYRPLDFGSLTAAGWPDEGIIQSMLDLLAVKSMFVVSSIDDRLVGIGRGAITGRWLGCFNFFVAPGVRCLGVGTALMRRLAEWGAGEGATSGFLQVEDSNEGARRLYKHLGFVPVYSYNYLVRQRGRMTR